MVKNRFYFKHKMEKLILYCTHFIFLFVILSCLRIVRLDLIPGHFPDIIKNC